MKGIKSTHDTHVLQVLNYLPWGRLHTHPRGILDCIRVDTSDQRSERRAAVVPRRRVRDVGT
jgi:hypothetical protein